MKLRNLLLATLVWWGAAETWATATAQAQSLPPLEGMYFHDMHSSKGKIDGLLQLDPAPDERQITDYAVYFTDKAGKKKQLIGVIQKKAKRLFNQYRLVIKDLDIPPDSGYIGVFPRNGAYESSVGRIMYIWDHPVKIVEQVTFADTNPQRGKLEGVLRWKASFDPELIAGLQVKYSDGVNSHVLPATYEPVAGSPGEYQMKVTSDMLSPIAVDFWIEPFMHSGQTAPGAGVDIMDNITADPGMAVKTSGVPVPDKIVFVDQDLNPGTIGGEIEWEAEDYDLMKQEYGETKYLPFVYSLYFLDKDGRKIRGIVSVSRDVSKTGNYEADIPMGTPIPPGATSIGIFLQLNLAEGVQPGEIPLRDITQKTNYAQNVRFVDLDPQEGHVEGTIAWAAGGNELDMQWYQVMYGPGNGVVERVKKGQPRYEVNVPYYINRRGTKYLRVAPVNIHYELQNHTDGFVLFADNTLAKTKVPPGKLTRQADPKASIFTDEDPRPGLIGGVVKLANSWAAPEGTLELYFYDQKGQRLASIGTVSYPAGFPAAGMIFVIPSGTPIPSGAKYVGFGGINKQGKWEEVGQLLVDNKGKGK